MTPHRLAYQENGNTPGIFLWIIEMWKCWTFYSNYVKALQPILNRLKGTLYKSLTTCNVCQVGSSAFQQPVKCHGFCSSKIEMNDVLWFLSLTADLFSSEISLWVGKHLIANHELFYGGGPSKDLTLGWSEESAYFLRKSIFNLYMSWYPLLIDCTWAGEGSRGHGTANESSPPSRALAQSEPHENPRNIVGCQTLYSANWNPATIEYGKLHSKRLSYLVVSCFMISAKLSLSASVRSVILQTKHNSWWLVFCATSGYACS